MTRDLTAPKQSAGRWKITDASTTLTKRRPGMTPKEIADRIRATATVHTDPDLLQLADELDPPHSAPGTVLWWKYPSTRNWEIARVHQTGNQLPGIYDLRGNFVPLDNIKWKPARVLPLGRVAVRYEELVDAVKDLDNSRTDAVRTWLNYYIAREEAARTEVEDDT